MDYTDRCKCIVTNSWIFQKLSSDLYLIAILHAMCTVTILLVLFQIWKFYICDLDCSRLLISKICIFLQYENNFECRRNSEMKIHHKATVKLWFIVSTVSVLVVSCFWEFFIEKKFFARIFVLIALRVIYGWEFISKIFFFFSKLKGKINFRIGCDEWKINWKVFQWNSIFPGN